MVAMLVSGLRRQQMHLKNIEQRKCNLKLELTQKYKFCLHLLTKPDLFSSTEHKRRLKSVGYQTTSHHIDFQCVDIKPLRHFSKYPPHSSQPRPPWYGQTGNLTPNAYCWFCHRSWKRIGRPLTQNVISSTLKRLTHLNRFVLITIKNSVNQSKISEV